MHVLLGAVDHVFWCTSLLTLLWERYILKYKIPSALATLESSWWCMTFHIRNAVDTFWPQVWNLWLCRGGGRLRQVVDKLMTTSEHVLFCGPISPGGNYRSRGSQDDAMFRAQDSAPEFIISFVYNAVFVTGETSFHTCGGCLEWKKKSRSDVMKTNNFSRSFTVWFLIWFLVFCPLFLDYFN
jgi:hypothetical protein